MMRRASMPSSRVVTCSSGSGSPLELAKTDLVKPDLARALGELVGELGFAAGDALGQHDAGVVADWMIMPCMSASTGTLLWIAANMVELCEGAPPVRQACSLTSYSSVSLILPILSRWKTYSAVISLARLAG